MTQQELKNLLARAAAEGWPDLDLRDLGLTKLPPEIGQLTKLRTLLLGKTNWESKGNKLTNLPFELFQLTSLKILSLWGNPLMFIPHEIGQLVNLTVLYLWGNQLTSLPPEICQLARLEELYLGNNELMSLPYEFSQLVSLTTLGLSDNKLTEFPSQIGQLVNLTHLYLGNNNLTTIPSTIGKLKNLVEFDLRHNLLTSIPHKIEQLTKLTKLCLRFNQLTFLPYEIGQLSKLENLDLSYNRLAIVPHEIGHLVNLTELDLTRNQFTVFPSAIGQLTNLKSLDLSGNQLTDISSEIDHLACITVLGLSGNQLKELPANLQKLTCLKVLDLRDNPDLGLSPELLQNFHNTALILDSYFADRRPLREAKLLLVGEADVGKTALARRLLHNLPPDPDQGKTPGIDIHKWDITPTTDEPPLTLNIWDFGGQGVYQATHQFFFTHRSLYLVVISSRRGDNESRLHHWLRLVSSLSDSAPIIVVANKQDQYRLALDERALKAQYPNLLSVVATSCTVGTGIDDLHQTIAAALSHLPHLNDTFPTAWFGLKQRLEAMPRSYITYEQYCDYCQEAGIDNLAHQRSWVQVLHQLGVVLNFQDRQLTATHVLKPNWVTDGIYRILSDRDGDIAANSGILTYRHLDTLLNPEAYPPAQHSFIVGMMQKFELCFPLPHRPNQFLIPDLLPEQQPDLPQLGFTATVPALRFQYHYRDLLPGNILPRFMVGMMTMLDRAYSWRSGAILQFEQNRALVQADSQNRKITVIILGSEATRRALLTSVRMQLAAIHSSFASLKVEEHVPIPAFPGQSISYRALCNLEARGIEYHYDPYLDMDLNVLQLLAGIETPVQRRELQLLEQLNTQYDLEAVRQLCYDLDVEYEDLEGEIKSAKTRALVQLLGRLGRLDELAAALERP